AAMRLEERRHCRCGGITTYIGRWVLIWASWAIHVSPEAASKHRTAIAHSQAHFLLIIIFSLEIAFNQVAMDEPASRTPIGIKIGVQTPGILGPDCLEGVERQSTWKAQNVGFCSVFVKHWRVCGSNQVGGTAYKRSLAELSEIAGVWVNRPRRNFS